MNSSNYINETQVYSHLKGEMVSSYSECWRHECECMTILAMPSRSLRNRYIDGVVDPVTKQIIRRGIRHARGQAAADTLRADTTRLFNALKEKGSE